MHTITHKGNVYIVNKGEATAFRKADEAGRDQIAANATFVYGSQPTRQKTRVIESLKEPEIEVEEKRGFFS